MNGWRAAGLLGGVLMGATVHAEQEDRFRTDRQVQESFLSEIGQVQHQGDVQVQTRIDYDSGDDQAGFRTPVRAELGVTDRWQLDAGASLGFAGEAGGAKFGDASAGVLFSPIDSRAAGFSLSTGVGVALPYGSLETDGDYRAVPQVNAYKLLGPIGLNLTLEGDLPLANTSGGTLGEAGVRAGLSAFLASRGPFYPLLEAGAEAGREEFARVSAGVIAEPVEALQLGVAFVVSRENRETNPGVFGSLVWEIGGK